MRTRNLTPLALCCALSLAGCSILPAAGPTALEVERAPAGAPGDGFVIVNVDDEVVNALARRGPQGFPGNFMNRAGSANLQIAVGDILQIAVLEAGGGLFGQASAAPAAGASTLGSQGVSAQGATLQPVAVGRDGFVNVPFAGRVRAAGSTPDQLRVAIESALAGKSVSPQVEVAVTSTGANSVDVGGEVNRASVVPLALSGNRLLNVIAAAGGAKYPAYETTVHVTRGGRTVTATLQNIVDNASQNIFARPSDSIYLSHDPRSFSVFGAAGKVARYPFDTERVNLAEALAEGGGFVDMTADPGAVYLFRYETRKFAASVKPDLANGSDEPVRVVYRVNLRETDGYFLAKKFQMQDKDIILVANAEGTQLIKLFALLRGVTGVVNDVRSSGSSTSTSNHF